MTVTIIRLICSNPVPLCACMSVRAVRNRPTHFITVSFTWYYIYWTHFGYASYICTLCAVDPHLLWCDMNCICFIIFQHHRNQRVQQPLWLRAALAIHALLFRREGGGRRDDRRWKRHPCPGLTTDSTGSCLTRVLRERTKKNKDDVSAGRGQFFKPRYFPY